MKKPAWVPAVEYLVSHAGRWVSSFELGDYVYGGRYSPKAPNVLIWRAQRVGVPIESSRLGYRIGRPGRACKDCGSLTIFYPDDEVCYGCVSAQLDLALGRAPYDPSTMQGRRWFEEEDQYIRDNYRSLSDSDMAAHLNRSPSGVRARRYTIGLGSKPYVRNHLGRFARLAHEGEGEIKS